MHNKLMEVIDSKGIRKDLPFVRIGDTVKVFVKVKEGTRERLQGYEGIVIAKNHTGIQETFTVRRISYGIGVERVFPLHTPKINHIDIVKHGRVRRAKLYFLRKKVGKAAKLREIRL